MQTEQMKGASLQGSGGKYPGAATGTGASQEGISQVQRGRGRILLKLARNRKVSEFGGLSERGLGLGERRPGASPCE